MGYSGGKRKNRSIERLVNRVNAEEEEEEMSFSLGVFLFFSLYRLE